MTTAVYTPAADIIVSKKRQRSAMERGPLDELKASILEHGLFHAVIVNASLNDLYLVAGARRHAAVCELYREGHLIRYGKRDLPQGLIPYVDYQDLDKLEMYQIEFEENMRRQDITWQDQCAALAKIDHLLEMKKGHRPSRTEVAELAAPVLGNTVKSTRDTLSQATIVNEYLNIPEVKSAKSLSKAYAVVSAIVEKEVMDAMEDTGEAPVSKHILHHGDLRDIMPKLDVKPNVIICDPPYGVGADEWSSGWAAKHHYTDDEKSASILWDNIIDIGYACTADDAHLYMFCAWKFAGEIMAMLAERRWTPYPHPIIWQKGPVGYPIQKFGLRHGYECIVYAIKGNGTSRRVVDDVIYVPAGIRDKAHAAQKPVKLYVDLLARHVVPGDTILDPCCGSGTVFPAANTLHAKAIGIETNETMYKVAEQTRRNADRPPPSIQQAEPAMEDDDV